MVVEVSKHVIPFICSNLLTGLRIGPVRDMHTIVGEIGVITRRTSLLKNHDIMSYLLQSVSYPSDIWWIVNSYTIFN